MLNKRTFLASLALCLSLSTKGEPRPVLHEQVVVPQLRCEGGICKRVGQSSTLPEAVLSDQGMLEAPSARPPGQVGEQVYKPTPESQQTALNGGAPPPGADPPPVRRLRIGPDRQTGKEPPGERLYHEVFNPAVFPFKRMTVLDGVATDETLILLGDQLRPLAQSSNKLSEGRDPFYGTVVVDLAGEHPVPIPSPAAAVRLLSYQVTPEAPLRFFADGADNLFVTGPRGRYRLIYLVDAEQRYFAGPLVLSTQSAPRFRDVPRGFAPPLSQKVQKHADQVLRHIGISHRLDDDYLAAVSRLIEYFREFQVGSLDSQRGSTYLDLALSQKGACRHRSYAFVITALGAGIPARYVENELHVFVEVFIPERGRGHKGYFRRVNLGGAALEQTVLDAGNKVAYKEKGVDPFPKPAPYLESPQEQVSGLPRGRLAAAPPSPGATSGSGEARGSGSAGGSGGGSAGGSGGASGAGGARGSAKGSPTKPTAKDPKPSALYDPAAPGVAIHLRDNPESPRDTRPDPESGELTPTSVVIARVAPMERAVYRGNQIQLKGQVQVKTGSAAGLVVYLTLSTKDGPIALGQATTSADGSYQVTLTVPKETPLGDHGIVARVLGDDRRRGSRSVEHKVP